jgi:hypothetical protein
LWHESQSAHRVQIGLLQR